MDTNFGSVRKGDITWLDLSIGRHRRGLEIWVKSVPQIEEFVKGLGDGSTDYTNAYDGEWFPIDLNNPPKVYQLSQPLSAPGYNLNLVGSALKSGKDPKSVNLSFLRLVGIGSPEGVRFGLNGPFSPAYGRTLFAEINAAVRSFILDYIVPFNINFKISSTDI